MNTNYPFEQSHEHIAPDAEKRETETAQHDDIHDAAYVEFTLLMSLALDGLLDAEQERQFQADLARYPLLAEQWQLWQELDGMLASAPAMEPPADFVQTFDGRLARRERRRRFWLGMTIGTLAVCMWTVILTGVVSVGAYVLTNQSDWLSQLVHNVAYLFSVAATWVETISTTTAAVANMPQTWGIALGYAALTAIILTLWTRFLRRSTQVVA